VELWESTFKQHIGNVIPADILDAWFQQPAYDCAVHRAATTGNVLQLSPIVQISPAYLDFSLVYLTKLVALPSQEPGVRAFPLFTDILLSPLATHIHSFAKAQPLPAVLQLS